METYFCIIQKVLGSNKTIQPKEYKTDYLSEYFRNIKCDIVTDRDVCFFFYNYIYKIYKYKYFIFYDDVISEIITNNLSYNDFSLKFIMLYRNLNNMFYSKDIKDKILDIFYKIQKTYHVLSRFVYIYRYRKSKVAITTDLFLNPIDKTKNNYIEIFQNNSRFLFTLIDLIRLINTQLSNAPYFVPEIKECKNPYNNIPFSNVILYNIYFHIKKSDCKMPILFEKFVNCGFNIKMFEIKHKELIIEKAIDRFIYNGDTSQIEKKIRTMLYNFKPNKEIHVEFPKDLLINIMRPYLKYYLLYTHIKSKKEYFKNILKLKLRLFFQYNSNFGRKIIKMVKSIETKKMIQKVEFNTKYIPFYYVTTDFFDNYSNDELEKMSEFITQS